MEFPIDFSFVLHVVYLQGKIKDLKIFSIICQIVNDKIGEIYQCRSLEEMNRYLFFNRGKYMIILEDDAYGVISTTPFEDGLCLN